MQIYNRDDWKHLKAHRLVLWEFGIVDEGFNTKEVNHIDGVKSNNTPKNLESVSDKYFSKSLVKNKNIFDEKGDLNDK